MNVEATAEELVGRVIYLPFEIRQMIATKCLDHAIDNFLHEDNLFSLKSHLEHCAGRSIDFLEDFRVIVPRKLQEMEDQRRHLHMLMEKCAETLRRRFYSFETSLSKLVGFELFGRVYDEGHLFLQDAMKRGRWRKLMQVISDGDAFFKKDMDLDTVSRMLSEWYTGRSEDEDENHTADEDEEEKDIVWVDVPLNDKQVDDAKRGWVDLELHNRQVEYRGA